MVAVGAVDSAVAPVRGDHVAVQTVAVQAFLVVEATMTFRAGKRKCFQSREGRTSLESPRGRKSIVKCINMILESIIDDANLSFNSSRGLSPIMKIPVVKGHLDSCAGSVSGQERKIIENRFILCFKILLQNLYKQPQVK